MVFFVLEIVAKKRRKSTFRFISRYNIHHDSCAAIDDISNIRSCKRKRAKTHTSNTHSGRETREADDRARINGALRAPDLS